MGALPILKRTRCPKVQASAVCVMAMLWAPLSCCDRAQELLRSGDRAERFANVEIGAASHHALTEKKPTNPDDECHQQQCQSS